jgi:hypothetical protein
MEKTTGVRLTEDQERLMSINVIKSGKDTGRIGESTHSS